MTERSTREAYGRELLELGRSNEAVVVLDSDLARSTRTELFAAEFPDRFYNAGIAEANMVSMAAGLAAVGLIPFATTYAVFVGRAFDQIRQSVAFARANVKLVATHSGLAAAYDGGSHQGVEDLALMRVLPGMTILSPADYAEARRAVSSAAEIRGPVYVRLGKYEVPDLPAPSATLPSGDRLMRDGEDVAVLATGPLVGEALLAAELLAEEGVSAKVLDVVTLKPFDPGLAVAAAACGAIVTAEEHNRTGGLYTALLEALAELGLAAPTAPVCLRDEFGQSGSWRELRDHYRLNAAGILDAVRSVRAEVGVR